MTELTDATFYAPLQTSLLLTNGSGYGTFARSSAKWMLNSNSVIEECSANIPTYHAEYGLHLNSAAVTNDMLYCRDFTNGVWVKTNVTAARSTDALIKHTRIAYLDTVTSSASPSSVDLDLSVYSQTYTYNSTLTSATATGASVNTYTLPSLGRYASPGGVPRIPFIISDIGTPGNAVVDKTAAVAFRDENLLIWNTNTYYVKPSTGSNSNAGTLAAPFATLTHAVRTATAGSTILCLEDFVEQPFDIRSTDASQTSQQAKLIDANGYNVIIRTSGSDLTTQTYVVDGTYTNCYKTTLSLSAGQALTRVLDTSTNDSYGYSTPFYMYSSAATLDVASGNGVYWDNAGRVLWVKIGAGTNVESQKSILKGLYSSTASTSRILIYGSAIGFSGVRFEGVQFVQLDQGSRLPQLWLHNCVQLWALDKGFDGTNCGRYIATNTIVYSSKADGANAFQTSAVGKGLIVTVNCQFIRNGDIRVYAHNGTLQGISAHGGSDHVSIGSIFALNNGQGVADTGGTSTADYTWLVGCSLTGGDTTAKNLTFQGTSFLGCSLLTATASNGTVLQTITAAATAACSGFYVKRSVGTGSIYITRDGGSNWTDITSLINSSTFTCVKIENTSVTNPQVGFKIATSGDAIIVDAGLNHAGTQLCEPIFTTGAAVTRNAEVLTYQTSGNFSDTAGTVLATFRPTHDTWPAGSIVGKASFGLLTSTANSGVQAADGTNTINGAAGSTLAGRKIGMKWSGSALKAFAGGTFGTAGSYDGAFNLTTVGINTGAAGYIRDVAIWTSSLSDDEMLSAACEKADLTSDIACTAVMLDAVIYASAMSAAVACDVAIFNNVTHSVEMSSAISCDAEIFNNITISVYMTSAISIESIFDGILGTSAVNITIRVSATYTNVARNGTYSAMQINADYP